MAAGVVEPLRSPEGFQAASARLAAAGFSQASIEIADAIGALGPLQELVRLEAEASRGAGAELRLLRARQGVMDRILLAMLDVSSTLAEIDCEGERGDHLRDRLQRIENRRTRRLSLATIMIGALTATVSGGLGLAGATGGDVAGILGGTAEASVASTLLLGPASGELLQTRRNLLRDVWEDSGTPKVAQARTSRIARRSAASARKAAPSTFRKAPRVKTNTARPMRGLAASANGGAASPRRTPPHSSAGPCRPAAARSFRGSRMAHRLHRPVENRGEGRSRRTGPGPPAGTRPGSPQLGAGHGRQPGFLAQVRAEAGHGRRGVALGEAGPDGLEGGGEGGDGGHGGVSFRVVVGVALGLRSTP